VRAAERGACALHNGSRFGAPGPRLPVMGAQLVAMLWAMRDRDSARPSNRAPVAWLGIALALSAWGCDAGSVDDPSYDGQVPAGDAAVGFDGAALPGDGAVPQGDAGAPAIDAAQPGPVDAAVVEMGRMTGMVEAHNTVRAAVQTTPALAPLTWSADAAKYAQEWADTLAKSCMIMHRTGTELQAKKYGENIAQLPARFGMTTSDAQGCVNAWASEKMCWTYGTLSGFGKTGTEKCDATCATNLHSDGCGHYTAIVARRSTAVGCGVATCKMGGFDYDIWVCNYSPAGNIVGQAPY